MFRIEKFLTIFELETGGQFIGYFGLISCSLILTFCILVISKIFTEWDTLEESLHTVWMEKEMNLQTPEGRELFKHTLIAGAASMIFLQIICIFSFILLVRGTRTHNPKQIKPSVLLFAMFTTMSILGLFTKFSPTSIVNFAFNFYIFVLLFSLYKKYQDQQQGRGAHIIITHNPNFIPIMYQEKA